MACGNGMCSSNSDLVIEPSIPLSPFFLVNVAGDYVAKGVGMRNVGSGTIDMTGLIPPGSTITNAFLYWAYIRTAGDTPNPNGELNGQPIVGDPVAIGIGDPCWIDGATDVFRANVTGIATNGVNSLSHFPSGLTDRSDPFTNIVPPLLDGASLVIIFSNPTMPTKTVIINDGGVTFFGEPVSTTLTGFTALSPVQAHTTYIVADGQANAPGCEALFNTNVIDGPPVSSDAFPGQDGIGVTGNPAFGGWDTLTLDVSSFISPQDTSATAAVSSTIDCLVYIAQILSVTTSMPRPPVY